jgi:hypothetical protein
VIAGNPGDFPYQKALMQASRDGEFGPALEHALEQYREDTDPENSNRAPQEFWPSTHRFRSILYQAGKRLGADAAVFLDRIPDANLRLFAEIELAAALAGLPELPGVQRGFRSRRNGTGGLLRRLGVLIRCPKCRWSPRPNERWSCNCRHSWNTFETKGLCPACHYQWTITACLSCGESSPHAEWYVKE